MAGLATSVLHFGEPAGSNFSVGNESAPNQCTFHKWTHLPDQPGFFRIFTIISVLTVIVVLVVLGNALVIAAVILRRRLRSATGLLILSLAVADLMVGLVVLPFSIANEALNRFWIFGDTWCTVWLTVDIWMCTASIYNLVAISIDRYIAIIKPLNYPMLITKFRARCMVAAVWIVSFIICLPSFVLASTDTSKNQDCSCTPANSGVAYIIFSASLSFYIPMAIVIFVYVRIYIAACAATKSVYSGMMQVTANANKNPKNMLMQNPSALSRPENMPMLRVHRGSSVAMKNPALNVQMDVNRSRTTVAPAVQNGTSSTVYAQMNGSSTSLHYAKNQNAGSKSPRLPSSRRHSEEDKQRGTSGRSSSGGIIRNGAASPSRLSTGSIHGDAVSDNDSAKVAAQNSATRGELIHQSSTTSEPGLKVRYLSGSNKQLERIREQKHLEVSDQPNGEPQLSRQITSKSDSQLKNLDKTTVVAIPKPAASNGVALQPISTNALLHPNTINNTTPTKKRSYGASMLTKIMRRGPRKRAGCAYEKRLSLEIKAAKTVAIVTGCFIFCWLGFSILYGFSIKSNDIVWSIAFWLGYLNSALNPVIYTVFNREFRTCFKRLLTCNHFLLNSQSTNYNMYNSYNSQLRPSNKTVGYSSVSAPPYYSRGSPPLTVQQPSSTNNAAD
uniref:G_PROTEIN_RECEP_F1_2 domain-containing protein n=1 Tax=Panagrellus redivivus TaxID=6233 RepID=A0A7E4WD57_PANRE